MLAAPMALALSWPKPCRVPEECCAESSALIYHCMECDPKLRPSAKEVAKRLKAIGVRHGMPPDY